jgi:hypothetical protein
MLQLAGRLRAFINVSFSETDLRALGGRKVRFSDPAHAACQVTEESRDPYIQRAGAMTIFLRKQLALFQERKVKPRRANDSTRWVMATLSRMVPWHGALMNVQADILIRWHRKGFRLFWLHAGDYSFLNHATLQLSHGPQ